VRRKNVNKVLPSGAVWVVVGNLPYGTADAQLAEWFRSFGFQTSADDVCMSWNRDSAMISVSKDDVLALIQGVITQTPMNGQVPVLSLPAKKGGA
jgi:hypothetical protein